MRRNPGGDARTVAQVIDIAMSPGSPAQRARALLAPLRTVTSYDAAYISLFDPQRRRQVPLVRHGCEAMSAYLDSPAFVADLESLGLHQPGPPVRLADLPADTRELPVWREHLRPAGFREGLGTPLFTADGRYVGMLGCNSTDARPTGDAARALLHRLTPLIAHAVDPLRDIVTLAGLVADATAAVILTHGGGTVGLPGLPGHRLLAAGSPVLTAATARLNQAAHAAFLCSDVASGAEGPRRLWRVTALACPPLPPGHLHAVVLISPPPGLRGLTYRELQVLSLLVVGRGNAGIAADLRLAVRTVTAHVEHILAKLHASSRTTAAVGAVHAGLYMPVELTGTHHDRP